MNTFISLLLSLILLHIIVDFYLQPNEWVQDKNTNKWKSHKLLYHSLLHALVACIPIMFITLNFWSILCTFLLVGISHWLIDLLKINLNNQLRYFFVDQFLHILILVIIAFHSLPMNGKITELLSLAISGKYLAIALGYVVIFKPASIIIGLILKKYTPTDTEDNRGLISGGEMIGYLERILILTFMIIGQYSVVGFILAAKSIFRFGELNNTKNHNLTEYVLLGSLLSVTITSIIGLLVKL